jgi:hypothetical protein
MSGIVIAEVTAWKTGLLTGDVKKDLKKKP